MTTFDELMMRRRSVREYDAEKSVSREAVEQMIAAALEAPTWKNSETGRYHVVMKDSLLMADTAACLWENNRKRVEGCGALIVTSFVKNRSGFHRAEDGSSQPDNELGNGWGCYDLGLQNSYLLLKAAELGIDTLIMGLREADELHRVLSIPDNETIVAVIAVGYRKSEPQRPRRKEIGEVSQFY
jgi:nitroreductase